MNKSFHLVTLIFHIVKDTKHLGILCDNNLCMIPSVDEAVNKLRTTF